MNWKIENWPVQIVEEDPINSEKTVHIQRRKEVDGAFFDFQDRIIIPDTWPIRENDPVTYYIDEKGTPLPVQVGGRRIKKHVKQIPLARRWWVLKRINEMKTII